MSWRATVLAALALVGACKQKEVPFTPPPPPEDAAVVRDASTAPAPVDAQVPAVVRTATKVVVGDHTSCAILSDTTLRCWGRNDRGQLGNGTTVDAAVPVKPALRGVTDVVLGAAHACALLDDSSVTCWGAIRYGQREPLLVPTAVPGLARARRVFAIGHASCATLDDASLVCWGDVDVRGHLRLSQDKPEGRVPTPAGGLDHVLAMTANGALHEDGTVSFWSGAAEPQRTALDEVAEIASAGDEVCGLRRDGSVGCVGPSVRCASALPTPSPPRGRRRAPVLKAAPPSTSDVETLRLPRARRLAFDVGLCVVTANGQLQCLSSADGCREDSPWPGLTKLAQVAGSCARSTRGAVRCWSVERGSRVIASVGGVTAQHIAASASHTCALSVTGEIACWGSNASGALGRGESDEDTHTDAAVIRF